MTTPIYAVGDIHGQLDMLDDALERIERDGGPDAQVVFLGDLTDRGPKSAGVIDRLLTGQAAGRRWIVLRGNHDRMYSHFLEDVPRPDPQILLGMDWFSDRIGGRQTLESYGIEVTEASRYYQVHPVARTVIPQSHIEFMAMLPAFYEHHELLFVHAGIRPNVPLVEQTEDDMCWIRKEFLEHSDPHPWLVVHGHTPGSDPVHEGNRINLDSGAGYGWPLTAAVFEGRDCWILTDQGRNPLVAG
ncbi:serine/threonine protein phosphatase 1 [Shimia gijangensis]|uniref:Serine/threonine protein phosphatase 1 n=1 Tax=Shimia gijangensis TaxID=1470563 RepID=A0A1M6RTK1_9RHOB|nr:metallophosphoesterase family protein [Shimia gijangensis]SHK35744.1 serine/threonine protein phosphatase 1 [Shimia gijangensis]